MERAVELLRRVKIADPHLRIRNYPHELSEGMRQRASSAASIGPEPVVLIADEPTTALDVTSQRQYLHLLVWTKTPSTWIVAGIPPISPTLPATSVRLATVEAINGWNSFPEYI